MKDVLQLAAAIVMASSAEKKNGSKSLKTIIRMKSFSDNFTVETDDEAQISLQKDQKIITDSFAWSLGTEPKNHCCPWNLKS